MTDSAIAARLVNALTAAADREAGAATQLVSVNIDMLAPADAGAVYVRVERKTRTLIFLRADFLTDSGAGIANAASVHKVIAS